MLRLTLCALLAAGAGACGKIKTLETSDAGPDDETDAGDDTPGEVTVELYDQFEEGNAGEPMVDQAVLFFGPDGELIEETSTDEDGKTAATVPPGSVVVIPALLESGERVGIAVFAVQPGDELVFPSPAEEPPQGLSLGTMNIEAPALDEGGGDIFYRAYNGCGSYEQSDTSIFSGDNALEFFERCVTDGEADVLVRAFESASGDVIETTSKHITVMDTGLISFAAWKGVDDLEIAITDVPAEVHTARLGVTPIKGGLGYEAVTTPSIEPDGELDVSLAKLDTFGNRLQMTVEYEATQSNLGGQLAMYMLAPDESDLPLALDDELLPWFGQPGFSEADRHLTWTRTAGGREPDAAYIILSGNRKSDDERVTWVAVVPSDWTEVTLPELPADYDDNAPEGYAFAGGAVIAIETNEYDGYEIRRVGVKPFLDSIEGPPPSTEIGSAWRLSIGGDL